MPTRKCSPNGIKPYTQSHTEQTGVGESRPSASIQHALAGKLGTYPSQIAPGELQLGQAGGHSASRPSTSTLFSPGCTRNLGSRQKCPQHTWKWLAGNFYLHSSKDGSRASWPRRSSSSPSQRRQLDNFNYFDDGGIADRRCGSSSGPRPPRQCAKLNSQSSSKKRSGAGSPSNVWGKGSSSLLHLLSDCMQID